MKNRIYTLVFLFLLSGSAFAQAIKPRFVHEPDLAKLFPKFLTSQGFLDPKYGEAVAKPSPYYSDFYGIQALADTTKDGIKSDFVPKFAEVESEDENTLTLKFNEGFSAKFYPHSSFRFRTFEIKFDHVEISGDTWQDLRKNVDLFIKLLELNKLVKKYLRPNPFFKDEQIVNRQLSKKNNVIPKVATITEFIKEKNSLLIYPEGVHGNIEGYNKLKTNVLDKTQFDWIAMEMLMPSQQKDLDIFIKSAENSPEYIRTRKVMLEYFKDAWNGRAGPKITAEENYYFKIVEQMRARKTRVIGIEDSTLEYLFFRYGESKFGAAVRSYWWAKLLPKTGQCLILGGSAHFSDKDAINLQDFVKMLNPKMKIFTLEEIKVRNN